MSKITEEIERRKALLDDKAAYRVAKLKNITDPFDAILSDLAADGWYPPMLMHELILSSPRDCGPETAWQSLRSGASGQSIDAHFWVHADLSTTVKLNGKLITPEELRGEVLDHVAKYYVKKEWARG